MTRVRLKDIADLAGSSVATVSMAMSNHRNVSPETRRKIQALGQQIGYRPRASKVEAGQPLVQRQIQRFGFVVFGSRLEDEVSLGTLHSIAAQAARIGARLEVHAIEDVSNVEQTLKQVLEYGEELQGMILWGMADPIILKGLENAAMPYVVFGHVMGQADRPTGGNCLSISTDEAAMGELAARRFLACGHRRIGFICEYLVEGLWNAQWLQGYRRATIGSEMDNDSKLVYCSGIPLAGVSEAAKIMLEMEHPPTAYIVPDLRVAASFLAGLRVCGVNLPRESIIVSGMESLAQRYGLAGYPWIGFDHDQLAAVVVRELRQVCVDPLPCSVELIVPFAYKNLPVPHVVAATGH